MMRWLDAATGARTAAPFSETKGHTQYTFGAVMIELSALRSRLAEAEAALHRLMTGSAVVVSARDGRRIEYSVAKPGDTDRLRAYIVDLKAEIAALEGLGPTRRPVSLSF